MCRFLSKAAAVLMGLLIAFTAIQPAYARKDDVASSWAANEITKWMSAGIIKGYPDGSFGPDNHVTQAEFAAILDNIFKYPDGPEAGYADIAAGSWYHGAIVRTVAAGVLSADSTGKIHPDSFVRRQDAAAAIARAFGLASEKPDPGVRFSDAADIAAGNIDAVGVMYDKGYIAGMPGGRFNPDRYLTRAELIKIVDNILSDIVGIKDSYSKDAKKSLLVNSDAVRLSGMTIDGDLFIAPGVGSGNVVLDNVTVKGRVVVMGGGENSIVFKNTSVSGIVIIRKPDGKIRIVAQGDTYIPALVMNSGGRLEEDDLTGQGFENVSIQNVAPGEEIVLDGDFAEVRLDAGGVWLEIPDGTVEKLEVGSNAANSKISVGKNANLAQLDINSSIEVSGEGTIGVANIRAADVSIEQIPRQTNIENGITAHVGGAVLTGGASNGSGRSSGNNGRDDDLPAHTQRALFDDFDYMDSNDRALDAMGWTLKESTTDGPGPVGCSWSKSNVTFVSDPDRAGNKLARLTSTTDGTNGGTSQAEIYSQRKFYEGTYAARVKFNDAPDVGPDGDSIVETFFTITPLDYDLDPNYSECDFEYMPNGGWGDPNGFMYQTTWETYQEEPWIAENTSTFEYESYQGWHTLVCTVKDGYVNYYIDGSLTATHSGKYYPRNPMSINCNLWFVNGGLLDSDEIRRYTQDIDWIYFAEDTAMTPGQVQAAVNGYRSSSVKRLDTVQAKTGPIPGSEAVLSVDRPENTGDYNIRVVVPAGSEAASMKLYENGQLIMMQPLTPGSRQARTFTYQAKDKPVTIYRYKAYLSNQNGTRIGSELPVEVTSGSFPANVALNKEATGGNGLYNNKTALNDGDKISEEGHYTGVGGEGLQWAQIDFGRSYDVNKVKVWHYYADGRIVHDLVIQLSNDPTFATGVTTVFNNDRNNSAGLGAGSDTEYAETADGKTIHFNTVNARYVRHYQNGCLKPGGEESPYNQIVELEVWSAGGDEGAAKLRADNIYNTGDYTVMATVPANGGALSIDLYENDSKVIDGQRLTASDSERLITYTAAGKAIGTYVYKAVLNDPSGSKTSAELTVTVTEPDNTPAVPILTVDNARNEGDFTVTVTIPPECKATAMDLYEGDTAVIADEPVAPDSEQTVIYAATGKPSGVYQYKAVLKNEYASSNSLGITVTVIAPVAPGEAANVALGKSVTGSPDSVSAADALAITDGIKGADNYVGAGENLRWIQIDLGQQYDINRVKVWHYYADGRTYHDIIVQVSNDADFSSGVITVFNNDSDDSGGLGAGTDLEYTEGPDGKTIDFETISARYVRFYSNGSNGGYPPANHYVEAEVWTAGD